MNRYLILFIILFFLGISWSSQAQSISIGSVPTCAGQELMLNVTGSGLQNVSAITLYIDIKQSQANFLSLSNIDPQIESLLYNYIADSNLLIVAWYNLVPANFDQKKLFDIALEAKEIPSQVNFRPGCEFADTSLLPFPVTYVNGSIESAIPIIQSQPADLKVPSGSNAHFTVSSGNTSTYQWESRTEETSTWTEVKDLGYFSGSKTNQLSLNNVPTYFNQSHYRCILKNNACTTASSDAVLQVDSVTTVSELDWEEKITITNYPNPFNEFTTLSYHVHVAGNVHIRIYSMLGSLVADIKNSTVAGGLHQQNFYSDDLPAGIYLCRLEYTTFDNKYVSIRKMIKK